MWRSQLLLWSLSEGHVSPFARQSFVAKVEVVAWAPSQKLQTDWSLEALAVLKAKLVSTRYTKKMCLASRQQGREHVNCSILVGLLLVWKVDVAELHFEIANCSCLNPPMTDSLLRSGSCEENMLTAPFKSCWRPCRSSFQCLRSVPDLLPECQTLECLCTLPWRCFGDWQRLGSGRG